MVREWERDLLSLTFRYSSLILTTHHSLSLSLVVFFTFLTDLRAELRILIDKVPHVVRHRGEPRRLLLLVSEQNPRFPSSFLPIDSTEHAVDTDPRNLGVGGSGLCYRALWNGKKMENIFIIFQLIYYQESLRPDRCKLQGSEPCQSWCSEEPISTNLCSSHTVWSSQHVHTS